MKLGKGEEKRVKMVPKKMRLWEGLWKKDFSPSIGGRAHTSGKFIVEVFI